MNSQTHILMGAVLFGKQLPRLAWAGAAGGVIPDLPMYVIIAGLRAQGYPLDRIFGEFYWAPWWQIANAIGHNFILWGVMVVISGAILLSAKNKNGRYASGKTNALVFALSGSALLHSVIDFLCHRDDAHMHLWPISQWRFRSPVSYWDPAHYGNWFGLFEAALGIALAVILFRRYPGKGLRIILVMVILLYIAVPAFFYLFHHGSM